MGLLQRAQRLWEDTYIFLWKNKNKTCTAVLAVACSIQWTLVQGFLSSRPDWLHPPPHPLATVALSPLVSGGRPHLLAGEEAGGANSDEGTDTLVL